MNSREDRLREIEQIHGKLHLNDSANRIISHNMEIISKDWNWLISELKASWEREKALEEALNFYANKNHWIEQTEEAANSETYFQLACVIALDSDDIEYSKSNDIPNICGKKARDAIAKVKGMRGD